MFRLHSFYQLQKSLITEKEFLVLIEQVINVDAVGASKSLFDFTIQYLCTQQITQ